MLFYAWYFGKEDPWPLYHMARHGFDPPVCPHPRRMQYFKLAMADAAFDMSMRLHGVHPEQNKKREQAASAGTEMRMPGNVVGTKPMRANYRR